MPKSVVADLYGKCVFHFLRKCLFSRVLVPFHSTTSSVGEIHLLCLLSAFGVVMFLFWLVSHYALNLHFING